MQNIQDLQDKIFFESKSIISILDKISSVDELLSKQNLMDELADRISFLNLLKTKIEYYKGENTQFSELQESNSLVNLQEKADDFVSEVTEEEAIFNNELNEIEESQTSGMVTEEEAIFNNQLNEIDEISVEITPQEEVFNIQLAEIDNIQESEKTDDVLSFVDEERILDQSEPESDDIDEDPFEEKVTEEEAIFNNELNEIDDSEEKTANEVILDSFETDEKIQYSFDEELPTETSPHILGTEEINDEILMEESDYQYSFKQNQDEIVTETSNVENILAEIKEENENLEEEITMHEENPDRRKIIEINKPSSEIENEKPASDISFENLEAYHQEKKIKLANIRGLKNIQTLFDDDPLERDLPKEKPAVTINEDLGSLKKSNIPTDFMEAETPKPEFRLDLNDRLAFTKMLFGGSQTDLNKAVTNLNRCKDEQEAKEYLSELYYERKWNKVDEYAQRLWILVENKFL